MPTKRTFLIQRITPKYACTNTQKQPTTVCKVEDNTPINGMTIDLSLTFKEKAKSLEPYIEELVRIKMITKQRLSVNSYQETEAKLHKLGLTWVTTHALKGRVKRAYRMAQLRVERERQLATMAPPPAARVKTVPTKRKKEAKQLKQSELDEIQAEIELSCIDARIEITELYYTEYLKIKKADEEEKGVTGLLTTIHRVPRGTFDLIHDIIKKKRELPDSFFFSYNACQKRINRR